MIKYAVKVENRWTGLTDVYDLTQLYTFQILRSSSLSLDSAPFQLGSSVLERNQAYDKLKTHTEPKMFVAFCIVCTATCPQT